MRLITYLKKGCSRQKVNSGPISYSVKIISNYIPDNQYSMLSHGHLVKRLLEDAGVESEIINPPVFAGTLRRYIPFMSKWLGYFDKFAFFPLKLIVLRFTSARKSVVHVIDHSNALYSFFLSGHPHVFTCNDLLAIRSARGDFEGNKTGVLGRLFQRVTLQGLRNCGEILCISSKTADDLSLLTDPTKTSLAVSLLPLNNNFKPLNRRDAQSILADIVSNDLLAEGFILHVGGNEWYKNRLGICKIYKDYAESCQEDSPLPLVLAGRPPYPEARDYISQNNHLKIIFIDNPSLSELIALYSLARVLLFASIEEGFGWPIIEAMACGCPVITTSKPPMTEVGGDAAIYIDPLDIKDSAITLRNIINWSCSVRNSYISKGLKNVSRFNPDRYAKSLIKAYRRAIRSKNRCEDSPEMKYRILITGITGQTGSYLAEILINQGHEVHGIVRRASSFNRSRIEHLRNNPNIYGSSLFLHYADLSDSTAIRRLIKSIRPDEIYHLAGQSHVGLSFEIPESTTHEIATATLSILEIIRDLDEPPRFFHASSSEVFGNAEVYPQTELTPFRPVSPYGCAKAFATNISQVYREAFDLFICNGIMYNHESPRRADNFVTRKISKAAAATALGSLEILQLGNLDAERDWGFAYEYADLIVRMMRHSEPDDYIVSTGTLTTVREFAFNAYQSLGIEICFRGNGLNEKGFNIHSGNTLISIDERYYRPLDKRRLVGDSSKARKVLNWNPATHGSALAVLMANADIALAQSGKNLEGQEEQSSKE